MGGGSLKELKAELGPMLRLAGPIVLGNLGQILIGVVDTFMIGQLGVIPLGAAAFVNNLFVIPLLSAIGLLAAVTILVAQSKGAADRREVGRHIKHGLAVTAGVSVLALLALWVNGLFLENYGQEPEVVSACRFYYYLIALSIVPALIYQCLKSGWEGMGWSNPPMLVLLSGIALNAFLNWVLIFGTLGAPALGLEGAGWATLISRIGIALAMFWLTLRSRRFRRLLPRSWIRRYEPAAFWRMLKLGLPMAAQHLFEVGAFAGAGIIVGWISKEALAAHQIAMTCAATSFMIPLGISIACGIRVGEAFGGNACHRLPHIYHSALLFTFLETLATATFFLLAGSWLAGLFVDDEAVVAGAASLFVVVGLFQIFDGAQITCLGALRGMSDVSVPMFITFVAYWVLALPAGYFLSFGLGWGAVGVWCGLALGLLVSAVSLYVRLRRKSEASL